MHEEEKHDTRMALMPMLITLALWLFMQVWLVGPLLLR